MKGQFAAMRTVGQMPGWVQRLLDGQPWRAMAHCASLMGRTREVAACVTGSRCVAMPAAGRGDPRAVLLGGREVTVRME
jgi:hypothetical protein